MIGKLIGMNSSEMSERSGCGSRWAIDMQEHFVRTGAYRKEDLYKVLGDPLAGVSLPTHQPSWADATSPNKLPE
jgi:hypothetical protein